MKTIQFTHAQVDQRTGLIKMDIYNPNAYADMLDNDQRQEILDDVREDYTEEEADFYQNASKNHATFN